VGDKSSKTRATHQPLAELATAQHGVVSTRQLARLGYTRSSASKANGVGRLHRVHRGVYRVGHKNLTWEGQCMAAVLAAAPQRATMGHRGVVASHFAAAWLWDVIRFRPQTIHVTVTSRRRPARRSFVVHEEPLRGDERAVREGIPVTSLARTYLDLAATERGRTVERMLDRAAERHLLDLGPVHELLARHPGHPGAPKLEAALAIYQPQRKFTRSGLERRFLELVREAGLPEPAMNVFVAGHEIDAWWEEAQFGVELDTYETHGSRLSFEDDRVRDDEYLLAGLDVTRVTETRLDREAGAVADSLRRHLARRAGIK
jgi:Transcriptional regulator, AbiEi antitoxin